VCTHTYAHIHARAHTHIHTDYIDRSFFLFPLSPSRTNMHTRHKSFGLSVTWRKLDAKGAAFLLKPKVLRVTEGSWSIPADETEKLFETLLTEGKWESGEIWVRADNKSQFRLSKDGVEFGKPRKQSKLTGDLKDALKSNGYVTDDMLKNKKGLSSPAHNAASAQAEVSCGSSDSSRDEQSDSRASVTDCPAPVRDKFVQDVFQEGRGGGIDWSVLLPL
jgi:hypothetical protein